MPPDRRPVYDDFRDDYDDDFALTPRERVRRRLLGPAVAFVCIGIIGVLGMAATAVGVVVEFVTTAQHEAEFVIMAIYLGLTLLGGFLFAVTAAGGVCLHRLTNRRLALTAAWFVAGLSVAGCYAILFYPFGIWALVLLHQPDVRREFGRPPPPAED